jgi:GntR family transcriptional regulator
MMPATRTVGPIWQRIADELREQIATGAIPPGGQLPTEADLTDQYQCARATARQALMALVNEGLIVSQPPRGYFVRDHKPLHYRPQTEFRPRPLSPEMDIFLAEHSADGREPRQTIDVAIVTAPEEVAKRLRLGPDDLAVVRRRVRYLDGEPYNPNASYFPLSLAQGTEVMLPHDIARGANQVLAEQGYLQTRALDEIYVRMPSRDEAARLQIQPGTPVACHICTGLTDDGTPVRVVINVLPGDRHVFERDRPRDTED